jgi:hypothetical protein
MKTTGRLAIAMYKPRAGKADDLKRILTDHLPTLRRYGLITEHSAYMVESSDGTIIEIFEWTHEEAKNHAHEHPAIRTIWGKMEGMCDFPALKNLPEANTPFPNFAILDVND